MTDPLDQLEHGIRQFLRYSAENPELLMMNAEGAQDTQRLDYIHKNYIERSSPPSIDSCNT